MRHHRIDIDRAHALLDGALHAHQADPVIVLHQLADRAHAAVRQVVDIVDLTDAILEVQDDLSNAENVFLAQDAHLVGALLEVLQGDRQTLVELHPANGGQVIALRVEEKLLEQRLCGFLGRRLARAHDTVNVRQRLEAGLVLVSRQRIAQPGATRPALTRIGVDVEHLDGLDAVLAQLCDQFLGEFVGSLAPDLAGGHVDDVAGQELAFQRLGRDQDLVRAALTHALGAQGGDLLAGRRDHLARFRVGEVIVRLLALPGLGIEARHPAGFVDTIDRAVIEALENIVGIEAQSIHQRRRRQLALAVDTHIQDVLGVELEIEPGAAIRNDPRGKQQLAGGVGLALVVIEEDARRTVHLGDDHPLGTVHDERALVGHQRDIAEIDVLLLHFLDGARLGFLVDIEHDQLKAHFQRRLIGQVALHAFFDVEFRRLELIGDIVEHRALGEVLDREHRLEDTVEPFLRPLGVRQVHLQELLVGVALNLDQVRHFNGFRNLAEGFADTFLFREGERHYRSLFSPPKPPGSGASPSDTTSTSGSAGSLPPVTRNGDPDNSGSPRKAERRTRLRAGGFLPN